MKTGKGQQTGTVKQKNKMRSGFYMVKRRSALLFMLVLIMTACRSSGYRTAPPFRALCLDGSSYFLNSSTHRPIFINFWATWCDPCKKEFPMINAAYEQYKDKMDFVLICISSQSDFEVMEFRETYRLQPAIIRDQNDRLKKLYNVQSLPVSMLINEKMQIVYETTGIIEELNEKIDHVLSLNR